MSDKTKEDTELAERDRELLVDKTIGEMLILRDLARMACSYEHFIPGRGMLEAMAPKLCAFEDLGHSIASAVVIPEGDALSSIGINIRFNLDPERNPAPTTPRMVDLLSFIPMRMMDLVCKPNSGQGFFYQDLPASVDGKPKYYPRYGNGTNKPGARVYLTRIIADADVDQAACFAEDHHSLKRKDLHKHVQQGSPRLPKGELGRPDAIKLAVEMFKRTFPEGCEDFTACEYKELLEEIFSLGDLHYDGPPLSEELEENS